jgi:hypothetical protein
MEAEDLHVQLGADLAAKLEAARDRYLKALTPQASRAGRASGGELRRSEPGCRGSRRATWRQVVKAGQARRLAGVELPYWPS